MQLDSTTESIISATIGLAGGDGEGNAIINFRKLATHFFYLFQHA